MCSKSLETEEGMDDKHKSQCTKYTIYRIIQTEF